MRIRLLEKWGDYPIGTLLDPASEALARRLVEKKLAVPVGDPVTVPGEPETASAEPDAERAAQTRRPRGRPRKTQEPEPPKPEAIE